MGRKKVMKDPQEELEAECKLLIDEATNLMKVRNYTKALTIYQKVKENIAQLFQKLFPVELKFSLFEMFLPISKFHCKSNLKKLW